MGVNQAAHDASADKLFQQGHLAAAVAAQRASVDQTPDDPRARLFLFELLALAGDLEGAEAALEAVQFGEMELDGQLATYRRLLAGEKKRRGVFQRGQAPRLFQTPSQHLALRMQACAYLLNDQPVDAAEKLAEAVACEPALTGQLGDRAFAALRDCDDLFGTTFELMTPGGEYFWVPGELVRALDVEPPRYPRDLVWARCRMELVTGEAGEGFMPARYPESHTHADEDIRLGRQTDWVTTAGGTVLGRGLRTYLLDDEAVGLFDLCDLRFHNAETTSGDVP